MDRLAPIHPGEILLEEFIAPMGISQTRLALCLRVPPGRVNDIVNGKRSITADTALRLAQFFGTSPQFWMNLQSRYDLDMATAKLGDRIAREVQRCDTTG